MNRHFISAIASLISLAWSGCAETAVVERRDHPTLDHSIMVGYQGWFRTPTDGANLGWNHYQSSHGNGFSPTQMTVDYWPDVSELGKSERYPTPFTNPDGSVAELFSSHNPTTVNRHFRWMREYHITGAFVQRFAVSVIGRDSALRRSNDDVLTYARSAAEENGRAIAVMYDLTGVPAGRISEVFADWKHLVDDLGIRKSSAYLYHNGRPLVVVWGVGFGNGRRPVVPECEQLIDFLKNDPVYGGNALMLGVPTGWREQTGDATTDPKLHSVLEKADIISPWTPGRFSDLAGVRLHAERYWIPDREWCDNHHLAYLPVVFPGFSWKNLKHVTGSIDRLDGRFLWEQYRQLVNHGVTMVYQAMFDEMNEGTQIFKTTNEPPRDAQFATYGPLPTDYYLQLVRQVTEYLGENRPMPEVIDNFTGRKDISQYLRQRDTELYAEAAREYEARRNRVEPPEK